MPAAGAPENVVLVVRLTLVKVDPAGVVPPIVGGLAKSALMPVPAGVPVKFQAPLTVGVPVMVPLNAAPFMVGVVRVLLVKVCVAVSSAKVSVAAGTVTV